MDNVQVIQVLASIQNRSIETKTLYDPDDIQYGSCEEDVEALNIAIEAVSNQTMKIARKPVIIDGIICSCPACGKQLVVDNIPLCYWCGQAIDWTEIKEAE